MTILLVEQRALHTVALADRTHVLVAGELGLTLNPADAKNPDKIVAAYLAS
jgi:ABC-type branched-subunit amino acid transport system ATPase component